MMKKAATMLAKPYPATVVVVDNAKALAAFRKKIGLPRCDHEDDSGAYASTQSIGTEDAHYILMIFPDNMHADGTSMCPVSVIAHECLHATQAIFGSIGERNIGDEAHAYLLDDIVEFTYAALGYITIKKHELEAATAP